MKRCRFLLAAVLLVFFLSTGFVFAVETVEITIDGQLLAVDVPPVIIQGRTLAPMRAVFESLGAEVEWDGKTKTVTAHKENQEIILTIGSNYATVNGKQKLLDVPGTIINNRTLVPLRFIGESLGAKVDWDAVQKKVIINSEVLLSTDKEFRFQEIGIGDAEDHVLRQLGQPARKDQSEYGFIWYIYNKDYNKYIQVGIENQKVVGLYTNADNWKSKQGIQIGTKKDHVNKLFGKGLSSIRKGNTLFQLNHGSQADVYLMNDYYATIFYDLHNQTTVTAIQLVEKNVEENMKSFYAKPSDQLKESFEKQVFDLANAIRARNNLTTFKWDEKISGTARKHSSDMAANQYFDHNNKRNESPFDRMTADGIVYRMAAENIAAGQSSAIFAHEGWMNSAGHRANILGSCTRLGVGVHFGGSYQTYYTQNFYTPK
ncbi:stalk domain-containing protein [Geosporobacter ferrireducens]|uniref:Copper amine oxidase n=1 Tax=Geosporobacter ferrireducens TaxID=1424294 RepID=A0A1D8GFV1_9FIRM|nr:CAP-associated domain-containing protein [Geosporobacter ferrireducens]AOT69784.1 hypothetical protein Gferi_09415 [Geosporobacter ferrireducens]MTI54503.1 copper amine oxidase [Geosporobacter ferrireducens]